MPRRRSHQFNIDALSSSASPSPNINTNYPNSPPATNFTNFQQSGNMGSMLAGAIGHVKSPINGPMNAVRSPSAGSISFNNYKSPTNTNVPVPTLNLKPR